MTTTLDVDLSKLHRSVIAALWSAVPAGPQKDAVFAAMKAAS